MSDDVDLVEDDASFEEEATKDTAGERFCCHWLPGEPRGLATIALDAELPVKVLADGVVSRLW